MKHRTNIQHQNLRHRIRRDAEHAVAMLTADKLAPRLKEPTDADVGNAKWLARNRDDLARLIVDQLLKHYTIRDRRR